MDKIVITYNERTGARTSVRWSMDGAESDLDLSTDLSSIESIISERCSAVSNIQDSIDALELEKAAKKNKKKTNKPPIK